MTVTNPKFNPSANSSVVAIKQKGLELGNFIEENVSPSHRRSVALTQLETALMWAVKAAIVGDTE